MTASETWARLAPDEISACPLCGREHTNASIAIELRDFEFGTRMAESKMRAAEREEHERIVNARTRRNQEKAEELRAKAIRRYRAGELVKNIAVDLGRTERWVYRAVPADLKRRRKT